MTRLLLVAMSLIAGMASAATIAGRVQLRDKRPLTGVTVTLGELKRTMLTDETGAFFLITSRLGRTTSTFNRVSFRTRTH